MLSLASFDRELLKTPIRLIPNPRGGIIGIRQTNFVKYPLYRATKHEYLEEFFDTGRLRIGTVWDFRNNKDYGDRIGDRGEGARGCYVKTRERRFYVGNINQDQYCLCLSKANPLNAFKTDGYDAYFLVKSNNFFREIALALNELIEIDACDVHPVMYFTKCQMRNAAQEKYKRSKVPIENVKFFPPAIIKPLRYSNQNEVRAIFRLRNDPLAGLYPAFDGTYGAFAKAAQMETLIKPAYIYAPEARKHSSIIKKL